MIYRPEIEEGERQMILLALFKLKRERPGWRDAIGLIEAKLGGQLDWPEASAPYVCLNCGASDHLIADCRIKPRRAAVTINAPVEKLPPARSIPTCTGCGSDTHTRALCPFE